MSIVVYDTDMGRGRGGSSLATALNYWRKAFPHGVHIVKKEMGNHTKIVINASPSRQALTSIEESERLMREYAGATIWEALELLNMLRTMAALYIEGPVEFHLRFSPFHRAHWDRANDLAVMVNVDDLESGEVEVPSNRSVSDIMMKASYFVVRFELQTKFKFGWRKHG